MEVGSLGLRLERQLVTHISKNQDSVEESTRPSYRIHHPGWREEAVGLLNPYSLG